MWFDEGLHDHFKEGTMHILQWNTPKIIGNKETCKLGEQKNMLKYFLGTKENFSRDDL